MKLSRVAAVLIGLSLFVGACKSSEKETPNGMKYTVIKQGDGVLPKSGEIVVFEFLTKDSKDSVWNSTYERGLPGVLQIREADSITTANEDGIEQMFRALSKGDSVSVTMPLTKFFKDFVRAPLPPGVDSTMDITYLFKIEEIMSEESFQTYQNELFTNRQKLQKEKDEKLITQYLEENNIKAERDSSGIYYVLHTSSGGQKPTIENCVQVNYEGKLLKTGDTFDKGEGVSFPLSRVIPGWQLGIPKLSVGDSGTLYIPSALAYGIQGVPNAIPPNSILVFDVELTRIGAGFDPQTNSCN